MPVAKHKLVFPSNVWVVVVPLVVTVETDGVTVCLTSYLLFATVETVEGEPDAVCVTWTRFLPPPQDAAKVPL